MIGLLLSLIATAVPADPCAVSLVQPMVATAAKALEKKDLTGAKAAITPAAACPVNSSATYIARIMRADIAVREQDWQVAHAMLADVSIHPESPLSATAGAIRLRADQGLGDGAAFARDRAALLAANDERLTALGKRIESFRVSAGTVTAYATEIEQGGFHRVYEFIVTPDDPAAFPNSILLTDDVGAVAIMAQMQKGATSHAWFFDLYGCTGHATLPPPANALGGATPDYPAIKAQLLPTLAKLNLKAAPPPERDFCRATMWVLPGFGARKLAPKP